jgi:starch synthase
MPVKDFQPIADQSDQPESSAHVVSDTPAAALTAPSPAAPAKKIRRARNSPDQAYSPSDAMPQNPAAPAVSTEAVVIEATPQVPIPASDPTPVSDTVMGQQPDDNPATIAHDQMEAAAIDPVESAVIEPVPEPEPSAASEEMPAPTVKPLYVIMITPELAPVAKVGGLADVVFGLSNELASRNNTVEIILPKYDSMRYDEIQGLHICYHDLLVPWYAGQIHCSVWSGTVHQRQCYFIEPHSLDNFFHRNTVYGCSDDIFRFAFFSRAALEFILKSGKRPEIIHCHDWATGLAPVMLFDIYQKQGMETTRACYTIHNFKHQGIFGDQVLWATGLGRPDYYYASDRLRDNGNPRVLNMMKAGIVYSNFVTTVSPHYAWEAQNSWMGFGMGSTLHTHQKKYGGIINGLDYGYWDPHTDPKIPCNYAPETIQDKYVNKSALRKRFMLSDNPKPIIAVIGRLDPQKGLYLVKHAMGYTVRRNAQFVLLGSAPDSKISAEFNGLKRFWSNSPDCHIELGFNEELAHLIYAGADMILVPSDYEPCGLTQLIALRYGTVPIVRNVGGLVDTVFDKDFSDRPAAERNGFGFNDGTANAVEWAINRAIGCYYDYPVIFRALMLNGMATDSSWKKPTDHYRNVYELIRAV